LTEGGVKGADSDGRCAPPSWMTLMATSLLLPSTSICEKLINAKKIPNIRGTHLNANCIRLIKSKFKICLEYVLSSLTLALTCVFTRLGVYSSFKCHRNITPSDLSPPSLFQGNFLLISAALCSITPHNRAHTNGCAVSAPSMMLSSEPGSSK